MKHFFASLAIFWMLRAEAQLVDPFANLDTNFMTTKYFANQSPGLISLKERNGQNSSSTSPGQGKQLVLEMLESQYSGIEFSSLSELRESTAERLIESHAVPLVILDFNYDCLLPWAIDSGFVDTLGGLFNHLPPGHNPFCKEELFSAFTFQSKLPAENARILLAEEFFFSNKEQPDFMEISLNNGQTFNPFNWGDVIDLPPSHDAYTLFLKFKRGTVHRKAIAKTNVMNCVTSVYPDLPPWSPLDSNYPWKIQTTWNDQVVEANAFVKFGSDSNDGRFTKPFIFVEGIDFNYSDVYPFVNGDFGWCQFSSGTDPDYSFLYNAPIMIDELISSGYDIILLDFRDGADFVQKNAEILIQLIHLINEYKDGDEPNVVSGASMGGQVTRYALRKMELQHDPHCTRLWISLDSPHAGAHIPLSLQYLLYFLANPLNPSSGQAVDMLNSTLFRPAARQFLLQQLPAANSLCEEYYQMVESMGYPEQMRKVAIANGSGFGTPQALTSAPLINYNVIAFGEPKAWLRAYPAPGQGAEHLLFSGRIPTGSFQLPNWLGGACIPTGYYTQTFHTSTVYQGLEFCSGGNRPTISQIVGEINEALSSGDCDSDLIDNYQGPHSFIPTLSALGLSMEDPFLVANDILSSTDFEAPFDGNYFAPNLNQSHSEITNDILSAVLTEVSAGENQLPEVLDYTSPNQGVFNAGREEFVYLRSLEINEGGKLYLNAQIPNYFAQDINDVPEPGSHINFFTSACGASLRVNPGAELHVGSHDGSSTASLTIVKGSVLILNSSGKIIVHPGSELIIDDEAFFYQTKGSIDVLDGAKVNIKPSAEVQISGQAAWNLQRESGEFVLSSNVSFSPSSELRINGSSQNGTLIIDREINFIGNSSSQLKIFGQSFSTPILDIRQGGIWNIDIGFELVRFKGVKALIHSELAFSSQAKTIFEKTELECPQFEGAEIEVFSQAIIHDSKFTQLQVRVDQSDVEPQNVSVLNSSFHGRKALLRIHRGKMNITNCDFTEHAQIRSTDLNEDSFVKHCFFEGDGPNVPYELFDEFKEAILDGSDIKLEVIDSEFRNYRGAGIRKVYGDLFLACNSFYSNHTAIIGANDAAIYMDEESGNGGNFFKNNRNNIELLGVSELKIKNGKNSFLPALEYNFQGNFNQYCTCYTNQFLNAAGNTWDIFNPNAEPEADVFALFYSADCPEDPWQEGCPIPVFIGPIAALDCSFKPDRNLPIAKSIEHQNLALLYPNPAQSHVTIESDQDAVFTLFDVLGNQVLSSQPIFSNQPVVLDIQKFSAGIYFLHLKSDSSEEVQKLIMQEKID